ncbi:hypothetical protein ACWCXX_38435 [Streptomyces sp. NPDC001732]
MRGRGHDVVAVDLPCDDDSAGLAEYADTVVDAIGERTNLILVAHSFRRAMLKTCGSDSGGGLAERGGRAFPSDRLLVIE